MAQLEFLNSPRRGERLSLSQDRPFAVGSGHGAQLRLTEDGLDDVHCVVKALKDGGFGLKDLGSAAGTQVNGKPITAVRLRHGDVVRIGSVELRYHDTPRPAAAPAAPAPASTPAPRPADDVAGEPAGSPTAAPAAVPAAAASERDSLLQPGTELGGYRVEDKLGQGGMGVVYRATQLSLNRQVALKVLSRHLTRNRTFVQRFVGEARAAARFNHPHIVQVYDVGNEGETYYFSMELVDQGSLEEKVRREGALEPRDAARLVRDAARGLGYAESLRVVHQDIKPDNLMLNRQGLLKIADLGLAADPDQLKEHMQAGTQAMGTPHFIAPEAVLKQPIDHRSDLYSLGCTFYRLLTGKTPFTGDSVKDILRKQVKEDPRPLRELRPDVPEAIAAVVARLMQKDPTERYQSAAELIAALDQVLEGKRRRTLTLVAAGVAVLAIGTAVYFATRPSETKTIVIEKDDPNAKKNAAELREMQAENKRLQIQKDLAHADRIKALEAIQSEFSGTRAAGRIAEEIKTLQQTMAAEERARKERDAALQTCVTAVAGAVDEPLKANDFAAAERALAAVPDLGRFAEEPRVKEAVEAARTRIVEAAYGHFNRVLEAIPEQLTTGKVDDAEAAARNTLAALHAPELGEETRKRLAALEPLVQQRQQEITARRAALAQDKLKGELSRYRDCLFGPDGVLAQLAQLRTEQALTAARKGSEALTDGPFAAPLQQVTGVLARAEAFRHKFVDQARSFSNATLQLPPAAGTTDAIAATIAGADPSGLLLKVPGKHGKPKDETLLWKDCLAPALLLPLFGEERFAMGDAERIDQAALLATVGLGAALQEARAFLAAVTPDQDPAALPEIADLSAQALLRAHEILGQIKAPELAEPARALDTWVEAERGGLELLCSGLVAFKKGRFTEASLWLTRLTSGARTTLAFGATAKADAALPAK